jgi:hypothetical protein
MKTTQTLFCLILLSGGLWAAPKRNTVDFYLSDPNRYLGTTVSLAVSHVEPMPYRGNLSNIVFFRVYTDGENGMRSLPLAVNSSSARNFSEEYGTKTAAQPKDYRNLTGKFRFVDSEIEKKALSTGLWYIGIMPGSYFIDATTDGQLDGVFDWYPEKTAAINSGKNVERVSAKEANEEDAIASAKKLMTAAAQKAGKKATIVKQDVIPLRDKKLCVLEYFLE